MALLHMFVLNEHPFGQLKTQLLGRHAVTTKMCPHGIDEVRLPQLRCQTFTATICGVNPRARQLAI